MRFLLLSYLHNGPCEQSSELGRQNNYLHIRQNLKRTAPVEKVLNVSDVLFTRSCEEKKTSCIIESAGDIGLSRTSRAPGLLAEALGLGGGNHRPGYSLLAIREDLANRTVIPCEFTIESESGE